MVLYSIVRKAKIITACSIVNPVYQIQITGLTEIIGFSIPIINKLHLE